MLMRFMRNEEMFKRLNGRKIKGVGTWTMWWCTPTLIYRSVIRGNVGAKRKCPKMCKSDVGLSFEYSFCDKDWKLCALFVETYYGVKHAVNNVR